MDDASEDIDRYNILFQHDTKSYRCTYDIYVSVRWESYGETYGDWWGSQHIKTALVGLLPSGNGSMYRELKEMAPIYQWWLIVLPAGDVCCDNYSWTLIKD